MILYSSTAIDFRHAVDNNSITDKIESAFINALGKRPAAGEKRAWNNSLQFMEKIVRNSQVADDCGILIEFTIPTSSKRVDFIISGQNQKGENNFVIVELKQWDNAEATDREDIVIAYVGGRERDMTHPSYQAWSYKQMLDDMNTAIQSHSIHSFSCSYLHNYKEKVPEPLMLPQYSEIVRRTPIYFKDDSKKFQDFLKQHVGNGKGMDILYQIENGKIKPSKKLTEHVASVFKGNNEYTLIDEQKVAYETILTLSKKTNKKRTIIVKGGPGTGKSVVSLNVMRKLIENGLNVKFVAPNAAFRNVIFEKLVAGTHSEHGEKRRMKNLFSGSTQFYNTTDNFFDVLVVDEAHRLKEHVSKDRKSHQYQGKNQVEDIIKASKINVFFIDDAQRIRPDDIGTVAEIKRVATNFNSEVYEVELQAQFRCSGAEGFINWLDTTLQIRETGNFNGWDKECFDFQVIDDPNVLLEYIKRKNHGSTTARMLAGFAWPWTNENSGNKNGEINDVVIPEYNFSMPWNSRTSRELWAIKPEGENQIGCIHTSQGLEFDYVGVIIGADLKYDIVNQRLTASHNDYKDVSGKKGLKNKPEELTKLVCNIYKTLMSRGMKGCYVFCVDSNLQAHFKERLNYVKQKG
ncbi:MAG: DUF2075 domain-containing protein [Defluviitaleaceae bacterium]|nr:DUF2075 domain-containing protein [Defluviitaleaceae bacterium]